MIKFLLFVAVVGILIWAWRGAFTPKGNMSLEEASRLLCVDATALAATIADAHRRLIQKVHPDAGGSAERAAKVNQARDVLLARIKRYPRSFHFPICAFIFPRAFGTGRLPRNKGSVQKSHAFPAAILGDK